MKTGQADVKSEQKVVGIAEYSIYDSVEEALEHEGDGKVLKLVNAQNKTDAMNATRTAATSKPTKARLRDEVFAKITVEEFTQFAGDGPGMQGFIDQRVAELEAEYEAKRTSPVEDEVEELQEA